MKKISFIFIPLMLTGFILPDDSCGKTGSEELQSDGPYVMYRNDKVFVNYIVEAGGTKKAKTDSALLSDKASVSLQINTDDPARKFNVRLKQSLENEKSEFSDVSKFFVLSDIEGNFGAFRKLLLAGAVIDTAFNWTFGNGHLVLIGDFVDRGSQVTEVLWFIYSLEDKARAAGGYVHYILGNHEIMNMSGDLRYVHGKYFESAGLLNLEYTHLYGENSELGRWLRTKNIVEKIGDVLFTHGGISGIVNSLDISVSKINKLVRPYYADSSYHYDEVKTAVLYDDDGPFWYRGYYTGEHRAGSQTVDSTLSGYRVKHIATGHTIVADTVSAWFGGKVLNTDVHHSRGKSEALFIDAGKYYRVNLSGEKHLLW